jgi:hypothetical protein
MKITQEQYQEFLKHLAWIRLKAPDYRLGQAFLNYFPDVSTSMAKQGKEGSLAEMKLFYEINDLAAQKIIDLWVDH